MSTPHRGSDLAINWIGRLGAALVRAPNKMLSIAAVIRQNMTSDPGALQLNRFPNSIDTLAPNNRFVMGINKLPITRTVTCYSIVGDRGRGNTQKAATASSPIGAVIWTVRRASSLHHAIIARR